MVSPVPERSRAAMRWIQRLQSGLVIDMVDWLGIMAAGDSSSMRRFFDG
jgi:hypothetical protein